MAFGAKTILPIDLQPSTGVGVSIPFNAPAVFSTTYTTSDAIKSNLINFFLTNTNDRYGNPTFGGNMRAFLFEQLAQGTFTDIEEALQAQLAKYFPTVDVVDVRVAQLAEDQGSNILQIQLTYRTITGTTDSLNLQFS
jgi:phage baseplate assembly protein W